jgi:uncharacterized protein (TIGR02001 family)
MKARFVAVMALLAVAPAAAQTTPPARSTEPGAAPADLPVLRTEPPGDDVTLLVAAGVATDYRFRSISQTDRKPFVYGLVSVQHRDFYLRAGAENVDFNDGTDAEYDLYAGWAPHFGDTRIDVGVVRYGYVDNPRTVDRDTVEFKASVAQKINRTTLGIQAYYAPDFLGFDAPALWTEANAAFRVTPQMNVSGAVGIEQIRGFQDFTAWNVGASYALTRSIAFDLRYYDTNRSENGRAFSDGVVGAVNLSF